MKTTVSGFEWTDTPSGRAHVCVWLGGDSTTEHYNLSDSTGDHPFRGGKWAKLPPETRAALIGAREKARESARRQLESRQRSHVEIARVWREDMIRYIADSDDQEPWCIMTRGLGGIGFAYARDCAELPTFDAEYQYHGTSGTCYDSRLHSYYGCLIDGGIVVDKRDALEQDPGLAFASPMLSVSRTTVDRFDESAAADSWLLDVFANSPENGFCGLARIAQQAKSSPEYSGFDNVPLSAYVAWWQQRGARIGQRAGNMIVWDDGEAEQIRPAETRFSIS